MTPTKKTPAQNQSKKPLRLGKESLKGLHVRSGAQTGRSDTILDSWLCHIFSNANIGC